MKGLCEVICEILSLGETRQFSKLALFMTINSNMFSKWVAISQTH